jgi:hypothetical protein
MLVIAWEALNEAIPRLEAEDKLSAYTVAVLASPAQDQSTVDKRQKIVDQWRQLSFGKAKKAIEVTVARLSELLGHAFGDEISKAQVVESDVTRDEVFGSGAKSVRTKD